MWLFVFTPFAKREDWSYALWWDTAQSRGGMMWGWARTGEHLPHSSCNITYSCFQLLLPSFCSQSFLSLFSLMFLDYYCFFTLEEEMKLVKIVSMTVTTRHPQNPHLSSPLFANFSVTVVSVLLNDFCLTRWNLMTSEDLWLRILRNTFLKNVYFASWVRVGFATPIRADSLKHPVFPLNVKTWNEYSFICLFS